MQEGMSEESGGGKEKEAATLAAMERLGIDVTGLAVGERLREHRRSVTRGREKRSVTRGREKKGEREAERKEKKWIKERDKVRVVVCERERGKERERATLVAVARLGIDVTGLALRGLQ